MICPYCEQRCEIEEDRSGICGMYHVKDRGVSERFPHHWSSYFVGHIESLPFFHAYPGARCLILGTAGCNASCRYCSNAYIARTNPTSVEFFTLTPDVLVRKAKAAACQAVVFAINEPTVSYPSFRELAVKAHEEGLHVGCLTNGCMTEEIAWDLGKICDFVNISLKSLSPAFYRTYVGIAAAEAVQRNIRILAGLCHIEVTTPVIQSVNDGEIGAMAEYLNSVSPTIPWHVFRLLPEYLMKDEHPPGIDHIASLLEEAHTHVPHIYFANFAGSTWLDTFCPSCGEVVIKRVSPGGCGGKLTEYLLDGKICPSCGEEIPILGGHCPWESECP